MRQWAARTARGDFLNQDSRDLGIGGIRGTRPGNAGRRPGFRFPASTRLSRGNGSRHADVVVSSHPVVRGAHALALHPFGLGMHKYQGCSPCSHRLEMSQVADGILGSRLPSLISTSTRSSMSGSVTPMVWGPYMMMSSTRPGYSWRGSGGIRRAMPVLQGSASTWGWSRC